MVTFKYNKYHQFTVIAIEKGTGKYKNREMHREIEIENMKNAEIEK